MGRWGILGVFGVILVATLLAIWMRHREYNPAAVIEAGTASVAPAKAVPPAGEPEAQSAPTAPSAAAPTPQNQDPEFQEWLSQEAKELDNTQVDGSAKHAQIRAKVRQMTPQQSLQLLQTVRNPKAPAGEKILSTYLLVEGGARTQKELADLIMSPLQVDGNYKAHSEEEMNGIREKSLRIMAIDGLFSQARSEPSAREALARAARETPDPSIRAYAEDKLRQLQ